MGRRRDRVWGGSLVGMDTVEQKTRRELTAREWLLVIVAGVVLALIGRAAGVAVVTLVGIIAVWVGLFGLVWRLLKGR